MKSSRRGKSSTPLDRTDAACLHDKLKAGEVVLRYLSGKSRKVYDQDEMLRDAVERKVEIFGEAARRLSKAPRDSYPEIPWRSIMATRHILAHDYDDVDHDILWRIVTEHIPLTLTQLRKLLPTPPRTPESK
jgi:uncharacterized protein with HEPN domain